MKIGIVTFHWAPNFGAILQAYATQHYLQECGHESFIIDYKPYNRDYNLLNCIIDRKFNHPLLYCREAAKDRRLEPFREKFLVRSRRYGSLKELRQNPPEADMYISGSDQVMGPRFLRKGERRPTTTYMLDFGPENVLRCGYALSFGCTEFPEGKVFQLASSKINLFDHISVREDTGLGIVNKLGYAGEAALVPDPVILAGVKAFDKVIEGLEPYAGEPYVLTYLLHRKGYFKDEVARVFGKVRDVDSDGCGIEEWVHSIKYSSGFITNSFHGVAFAILYHVPFVAILESGSNAKMNDRFYTLLKRCSLEHRIISQYNSEELPKLLTDKIDWDDVDRKISSFRESGARFLEEAISGLCKGSV